MEIRTFPAEGAAWAKAWRPEWPVWRTGNHQSGYNIGSGFEDGGGEEIWEVRWGKIVKGFELKGVWSWMPCGWIEGF